jgi:hypothetical protein
VSRTERVAGVVVGAGRLLVRLLPAGLKRTLDDRLFGAIFQVTRVTNDAYGWKAPPPGGEGGETGEKRTSPG